MLFDIVIPLGEGDIKKIYNQINYTKQNIIGYRNIYIVTPLNITIDGCIIINENIFPFTKEYIKNTIEFKEKSGWYLQQLIKLYSLFVIDGILDKILVLDADTFFLKPTHFIVNNKILLNYGTEHHKSYFSHMNRLHPSLKRVYEDKSGITHHCIFDKEIIQGLFKLVEDYHKDDFWKIFLNSIDEGHVVSGASEYEIYFNYCLIYHSEKVELRYLIFNDVFNKNQNITDFSHFIYYSDHYWL